MLFVSAILWRNTQHFSLIVYFFLNRLTKFEIFFAIIRLNSRSATDLCNTNYQNLQFFSDQSKKMAIMFFIRPLTKFMNFSTIDWRNLRNDFAKFYKEKYRTLSKEKKIASESHYPERNKELKISYSIFYLEEFYYFREIRAIPHAFANPAPQWNLPITAKKKTLSKWHSCI